MAIVYGIVAFVSIILVGICYLATRKKNIWLFLLFLSVAVCDVGYFLLSISKTLEGALFANRVAYLGSVFLPLFMWIMIMELCRVQMPKLVVGILTAMGVHVLLVTLSQGILPIYYKNVSLEHVDGMTRLVKEYGILHPMYTVYVFMFFVGMVGTIAYSIARKTAVSVKHSTFLAMVVLGNIGIWIVEKFIPRSFEFLSVSYLMTEVLILLLYEIVHDYGMMEATATGSWKNCDGNGVPIPMQEEAQEDIEEVLHALHADEALTGREREVFRLLLQDKKRRAIAETLGISENTVKTHTKHIFEKIGVSSRSELFERIHK